MSKNWLILTITILILGTSFRLAHLGDKIFWVDEVATITRISGYTIAQIISEIQKQDIIYASDLWQYQQLSPDKTFVDTIKALIQSPEHAPLYFILARFWVQLFGDSIVALRSLSIIFGLLCLPSIYFFSQELFNNKTASRIGLLFLTISPFYVAYSQEARPYSLWTLLILTTNTLFLKCLESEGIISPWKQYKAIVPNFYWYSYLFTTILNLYTSLFSWLILFAHGFYLILSRQKYKYALKKYLIILIASFIIFIPWFWIILNHWHQLQDNTSWMDTPMELSAMLAIWVASILLIFGNLPLASNLDIVVVVGILILLLFLLLIILGLYYLRRKSYAINYKILGSIAAINVLVLFMLIKVSAKDLPWKSIFDPIPFIGITTAFGLLFLVAYSLFFVCNQATNKIKYFVFSLFFIPTLTLIVSDLILQDQRSATPRYLIPAQLAIIFMVTYLLSQRIKKTPTIVQLTLNSLLILGIVSCSLTWKDSPQFQKSRNYHNPAIENLINQSDNALVISESRQVMDLLSMSHNLNPEVVIKFITTTDEISSANFAQFAEQDIFIFNPHVQLIQNLEKRNDITIKEIYKPHLRIPGEIYLSLWSIKLKLVGS